MQSCSCILVPGGFGDRGVPGMILAAKYARENKIPYLGICLGMQISVIEFSRFVSTNYWFISLFFHAHVFLFFSFFFGHMFLIRSAFEFLKLRF